MLHLITAEGCAWIAAETVVGIRRGSADHAIVHLQDGRAIVSLERYESFINRLNDVCLRAARVETLCPPQQVDVDRATIPVTAPWIEGKGAGSAPIWLASHC